MKVLFCISLLLNLILGVLFIQEKNQPPIERIILEKKAEPKVLQEKKVLKEPVKMKAVETVTVEAPVAADPSIIVQDEQSFVMASEEIVNAKKHYLEDLEISEQDQKKKEEFTQDFYRQTDLIYKKYPMGMGLSFEERHKVIELEQNLHRNYEKLLGKKKWQAYQKFVDDYNQKVLKNHKTREFAPLMMGY